MITPRSCGFDVDFGRLLLQPATSWAQICSKNREPFVISQHFVGEHTSPVIHPIIALWCVPRSVSTAFERMMAARGDITIITEPFSDAYYYGSDRVSSRFGDTPETPPRSFHEALAAIHAAAVEGPVFFKDMALHVRRRLTPDFLAQFTNVVLTRDPRFSIVSLYKRMPDFTLEEVGFDALGELVEVLDQTQSPTHVMDGELIRANPEQACRDFCDAVNIPFEPRALNWEEGGEEHWNRWQDWFTEAASSTRFRKPQNGFDEETLAVPIVRDAVAHCLPIYKSLRARVAEPGKA